MMKPDGEKRENDSAGSGDLECPPAGRFTLFMAVIVLIVARCPYLFVKPRFWAEEGSALFAYAYNHSFFEALFTPPSIGYYAFFPNLAAALAAMVPLEYAPFVTTYFSLAVQIIASGIVIWGNSPYWDTLPKKAIIAAGIQLVSCEEIWLNSNGLQYWLCVITFLILLERGAPLSLTARIFYRGLLASAGLTGVVSVFLLPLYIWSALRSGEREIRIRTAILLAAGLIQAGIFFAASLGGNAHLQARFGDHDFVFARVMTLHLALPFFGTELFNWKPLKMFNGDVAGFTPAALFASASVALLFCSLFWRTFRSRHQSLLTAMAFLLVTVLSVVFSIRMASSPRYIFAPSIMILVLFVECCFRADWGRWQRTASIVLVAGFLMSNAWEFRQRVRYSPQFPQWKEEVALWRQDPYYLLGIWPQFRSTRWYLKLEPRP